MTARDDLDSRIRRRHALLDTLRIDAKRMFDELAQVIGSVSSETLHDAPTAALDAVAEFCRVTDFAAASDDGRTWLRNRLGLYVTRYFLVRYGGSLDVQDDPARRFYLHFVVTGMALPIAPGAALDPFAIAHDVIEAMPKSSLADSIHAAERSLLAQPPGQ